MKRILVIVLSLFALLTVTAVADEAAKCGENLTWSLSGGVLTISGSGDMAEYSPSYKSPWYENEDITEVVIENGVTSIGYNAFYGCTGLTSVTIPESITAVETSAFAGCTGIRSVYADSIESWCGITFSNEKANPMFCDSDINDPGADLYCGGEKVRELVIPDTVTSIGAYQFYGCTSIVYAVIPDSVTSIGTAAFYGCTGLIHANIPSGITALPNNLFNRCSSLRSITIPSTVTSLGTTTFTECSSITNMYFSGTKTEADKFDASARDSARLRTECSIRPNCWRFSWSLSETGVLTVYTTDRLTGSITNEQIPWLGYAGSIKSVVIKDGVEIIAPYAFYKCTALESVIIPASVTTVGTNAFSNCTSLETVAYLGSDWSKVKKGTNALTERVNVITAKEAYLLGDVNQDDNVKSADTKLLFEHILGGTVTEIIAKLGNVNGDTVTDIGDVQRLYRHVNGKETLPNTVITIK